MINGRRLHFRTSRLLNGLRRWFTSWRGWACLVVLGMVLSGAIAACTPSATDSGNATRKPDVSLTLVGYAVPKAAHDAILPKFQALWQAQQGQTVNFRQSYGASGAQSRAIMDGLDADVVHLAIASDVNRLVKAGLVADNWTQRTPNNGIVGETVAALVVRPGNPKNIQSFADLTRADITWVTADPKSSGGARWNYFALWNHAKKTGADDAQALQFVTQAYQRVVVLARDAREATDAFANQGQGDALVTYENEVILANQRGESLEKVIPSINISIDTPIAMIDQNVDRHGAREVAQAFTEYLFTPEAQREFAKVGFRPVGELSKSNEFADQFPPIQQLGRIEDYGGWQQAQKVFEDGGAFDQIRAQLGKS